MARSYRKSPFHGNTTAASEKLDKQQANRRLRVAARSVMTSFDPDASVVPVVREVSDTYCFAKDGKHFGADAKSMRK